MKANVVSLPRSFNVERFMDDLFRADPLLDELFPEPNKVLDTIHLADGENFADEIAHSPFPCDGEHCQARPCVDLRRALLERNILLAHPFGFMVPQ